MLMFFPFVGLLLGLLTTSLYSSISHLGWYGAIISAIVYMILYGFIHTEAIVDVFDAMYASHSGKDAYEIIKEPTVGAIGVLYATVFVIMKIAGVVFLLTHNMLMEFIAILLVSRLSLLTLFIIHDFKSSFPSKLKEALDYGDLIVLFIIFLGIGSFFTLYFFVLLIVGLYLGFLLSLFLGYKIGFVNGDVLGATLEGVEIILFFVVALFV